MRVQLNHSNHTYTDRKGQLYKAVSSIIGQYKQPFDAYAKQKNGKTLIENYVQKNGQSEQYWLDKWDAKRDFACEKGTAFHNLKEMFVNSQAVHRVNDIFMPVQNQEKLWQLPEREGLFHLLPPGTYTELCVWNYQHRVAGTADLVTIYPNKEFDIDDYKTNGEFRTEAFMGKPMKWPFITLQDCHLGHYTVQLSMYAWMLEQFGLKPRNLRLHHYDIPDNRVEDIVKNGILPEIAPTIYPVNYVHNEISIIMKERLLHLKRDKRWVK